MLSYRRRRKSDTDLNRWICFLYFVFGQLGIDLNNKTQRTATYHFYAKHSLNIHLICVAILPMYKYYFWWTCWIWDQETRQLGKITNYFDMLGHVYLDMTSTRYLTFWMHAVLPPLSKLDTIPNITSHDENYYKTNTITRTSECLISLGRTQVVFENRRIKHELVLVFIPNYL